VTTQGVVVLDILGLVVLLWILNLTRLGRLYVGYGVVFIALVLATLLTVSMPPLRSLVGDLAQSLFPNGGLLVIGFSAAVLVAVYVFTQLTVIANRLSVLVQEIALLQAAAHKNRGTAARPPEGEDSAHE
jgi:hypothetical protein